MHELMSQNQRLLVTAAVLSHPIERVDPQCGREIGIAIAALVNLGNEACQRDLALLGYRQDDVVKGIFE